MDTIDRAAIVIRSLSVQCRHVGALLGIVFSVMHGQNSWAVMHVQAGFWGLGGVQLLQSCFRNVQGFRVCRADICNVSRRRMPRRPMRMTCTSSWHSAELN
jgi:hypothetical protein